MNVIRRATLEAFWRRHPDAEHPLKEWFRIVRSGRFERPLQVLEIFPKAKAIDAERLRFEICGGRFRLVVAFKWSAQVAFVKFVGTHREYDKVDARTVGGRG